MVNTYMISRDRQFDTFIQNLTNPEFLSNYNYATEEQIMDYVNKAVKNKLFWGSVKAVNIKATMIKSCDKKSQLFLWPKSLIGIFKLSITGDQINLNEYAKAAQLNIVIVLLLTPALTNQTDNVENTRRIGRPEEKPSKSILTDLIFRKIFIKWLISPKRWEKQN